eukprot:TRINITY_DN1056_c2_g1_i1.p1 TRINITY_DN1056_c2_g1~~TRINITY_DN1056_c2_g1_i1.p1  ORF type:complete len:682 (+),score=82.02 TRINITY_DN1056_c2_g1_i1:121-2166(+)
MIFDVVDENGKVIPIRSLWEVEDKLLVVVRSARSRWCQSMMVQIKEANLKPKVIIFSKDAVSWKKQTSYKGEVYSLISDCFKILDQCEGGLFIMSPGDICRCCFVPAYPGHQPDFGQYQEGKTPPSRAVSVLRFALVAIGFSITESSFVATVAVAPTVFPAGVGTQSSGALFLSFAVATIFSPKIVQKLTPRPALIFGLLTFVFYIACTLFCFLGSSSLNYSLLITSSILAGIGGAALWTAEGLYMSRSAEAYSLNQKGSCEFTTRTFQGTNGEVETNPTDFLSGVFNTIFQISMPGGYLLAYVSNHLYGAPIMYGVLFLFALFGTVLAGCVNCPRKRQARSVTTTLSFRERGRGQTRVTRTNSAAGDRSPKRLHHKKSFQNTKGTTSWIPSFITNPLRTLLSAISGSAMVKVFFSDIRIALLVPYNMSMGTMACLLNTYINARVVGPLYSSVSYIECYVALLGVTAALLAPVFSFIASSYSRFAVVSIGCFAWSLEIITLMLLLGCSSNTVRSVIPVVYVLHGIGFSVWQGTATAIHADLHSATGKDSQGSSFLEASFAHMKLWSAIASGIGFLVIPSISVSVLLPSVLLLVVIGLAACASCLLRSRAPHFIDSDDEDVDLYMKKASSLNAVPNNFTITDGTSSPSVFAPCAYLLPIADEVDTDDSENSPLLEIRVSERE